MHPASLSSDALIANCTVRALRRGGPGGQHRNKVETAIVIEHTPTGILAEASERRSQAENRREAIRRLRLRLAIEHRDCESNAAEEPETTSVLWQSRVSGKRISVSPEHDDFPSLLAELLDHLHVCGFDLTPASQRFAVTTSQLVNFLRAYPPALMAVNARRAEQGLHKLR